ncbi:MAG: hypothetical protein KTR18_04840 [Acidiferrobacterales bacterium]|nr:hypothetical protein [Acidiferrobacterales bacterium]
MAAEPAQPNLFSPHWHRVAKLKPRLRKHVQLHRHQYRGQDWYVFQDHASGRFHRFTSGAYYLIGLMDGNHTLDDIWRYASVNLEEESLTQGQVIQLLSQLYKADALLTEVSADTKELFQRQHQTERRQKIQRFKSPLSIKVPLIDPDRFIVATLPMVRWIFTRWGFALWILVVGVALINVFAHWPELTGNLVDRVLAGQNLLILLVTFPLVKLFHEYGHAYAARIHGGEIHEMGVMFLILMPIPYVDATSSSAFSSRWKRALVGSAGMLVELFIAAIALHIWLEIESGFLSAVLFNVMVIAGVSTLLFNANPLIRFDGYYILADLIEIPNLGTRSTRYLGYLVQKYLFGLDNVQSPARETGERIWFVSYGIASFIYRLFLISFIVFLLVDKYFIIGTILALWAFVSMAIVPAYKQLKFVMTHKKLKGRRTRAIITSAALVSSLVAITLIPLPLTTIVEGVVWSDQDSRVRMSSQGFVTEVLVKSGAKVSLGQPLYRCSNFELQTQQEKLQAQLKELTARHDAFTATSLGSGGRVQADLVKKQIMAAELQLESIEDQIKALTVVSPSNGIFIAREAHSLKGRFIERGNIFGFIRKQNNATVRVLVPQDRINLVRQQTDRISVRVVDRISSELDATLTREVPRASQELPSAALTIEGGGLIAVNPGEGVTASDSISAFQSWFQFDIEIERAEDDLGMGERVYARFWHGYEPLATQLFRTVRQTFLSKFNV